MDFEENGCSRQMEKGEGIKGADFHGSKMEKTPGNRGLPISEKKEKDHLNPHYPGIYYRVSECVNAIQRIRAIFQYMLEKKAYCFNLGNTIY